MKRFFLFCGISALFVASCSIQEKDFISPEQEDAVFYASFERPDEYGTKVYVNENFLLRWTANDRVSIFNKNTYNQQYLFTGETGDNAGGFSKVETDEFVTGSILPHVVSVYPYRPTTKISEDEALTITLPGQQVYAENSFGLDANTMVSVSTDNFLQYKSVGGFLVFKLYGEGVSISSITLKGNNGEKLAGKATVSMPLDGSPSIEMSAEADEEIVLTSETPVTLGTTEEQCTLFWFVLPPTTFEKGLTITASSTDGAIFEKSTSNTITVERNKVSTMKALEWSYEYVSSQTFAVIDGLSYKLTPDGFAQVDRQDKSLSGDIVIPEKVLYQGVYYTVNSIIGPKSTATYGSYSSISADGAAFQGTSITSVVIPATITSLPSCAFISCRSLTTVVLPSTLNYIGFGSFAYCSALSEINVPDSVSSIGIWAFGGCSSLKSFIIPSGLTSLSRAMLYQSGIESIEIPATVTSLKEDCLTTSSLKTVKSFIRDITRVSYTESCFGNVSDTDLYVPSDALSLYQEIYPWKSFKSITGFDDGHSGDAIDPLYRIVYFDGLRYQLSGDEAMVSRQDRSLSGDIVIPEKVTYNGIDYTVKSIIGPKSTATYGSHSSISADGAAFQGTSITSVVIPATITSLPSCAFISCRSLTTVVLPSTLNYIGFGSFAYCSALSEINVPDSVSSIGIWAFGGCSSLKSFIIPSGLTSLSRAMLYQSGIESIEIPATVTSMKENCLSTSSLKTVKSYIMDITRGSYTETCFGNVSDTDLYVPSGTKAIYQEYYPWKSFKSIIEF